MTEYVYYSPESLDFPLNESIRIIDDLQKVNENFMISNSKELLAEAYAPEIDFYIKNSKDDVSDKIKIVELLYAIKGIKLDFATDFESSKDIGDRLLIVGEKEQLIEIESLLSDAQLDLYFASSEFVSKIEGTIGDLVVSLNRNGKITPLSIDQMVWFNAPKSAFVQNGVYDPLKSSIKEIVDKVLQNIQKFTYKKAISYNPDICQYKGRRTKDGGDICGDCANICPTNAILKIDEKKELSFSDIDCETCGGCVSVCPSGALDLCATPREYIYESASLLRGKIILVIPEIMELENLKIDLPTNVVPLMVGGRKFLHEAHFISLFQQSGFQVVFYTDFISKGSKASLDMVNDISQRKYGKDMILVAQNKEELQNKLNEVSAVDGSSYSINELGLRKREIFSARLSHLVGKSDLGVYENHNEYIHYGKVIVNEQNCTLCLSCVGACNVGALTAHPEDNTLRFDASICTDCTYCEVVCPESECISIVRDKLELKAETFGQRILAKDELFACVECGKEFAPKKAVMKIAQKMTPLFAGDKAKIRTLYCCETCKAKVMLKAQIGEI